MSLSLSLSSLFLSWEREKLDRGWLCSCSISSKTFFSSGKVLLLTRRSFSQVGLLWNFTYFHMLYVKYLIVLHYSALWAKTPPFFEGIWKNCRPRASKTARGPEGSFGGPRTAVFNQSPEEKGGVLSLYPGFARFPHHFSWTVSLASNASAGQMTYCTFHKLWQFGSTVSQTAMVCVTSQTMTKLP